LINIVETIEKCESTGIKAVVLALDQEKAFDSVRHDFMRCVLKFFNFPEKFIKIIEVFTTNRTARIILADGKLSDEIPLEIGNTQGNAPSPLQFNFCEQIFIFKIEFDAMFESVYQLGMDIAPEVFVKNPELEFDPECRDVMHYESNRETDNVEGFADDASLLGTASENSIDCVKTSLCDFAKISGLRCNVEKSSILPVGFRGEMLPDYIVNSGFTIVEEVKILGITITNDYRSLSNNFNVITTKLDLKLLEEV
jgi:Reverse transcriptase (RNA-dependent DNA polymerase)